MKWKWDVITDTHFSVQSEDDVSEFIIRVSTTENRFSLGRKWICGSVKGSVDYIGTFKSIDKAKEVAKLIREG